MFVFTPRFVYWRALDIAELERPSAEVHRAFDSVRQLDDPWAPVEHPTNKVIAWRLLFPLIWHYLHLPRWAFLAMPQVGCVLVLWLVAWISHREFRNWPQTWMTTTLFATLLWFFVSTGWLTYFDSWLVLGLLVVAFVESRLALALTCLATPWVDERFVMALPVLLSVRAVALGRIEDKRWRFILVDVAIVFAASIPYPAIRAAVWLHGDPESTAYVQTHWDEAQAVSWMRYVDGLWSGFRAAWIAVGAAIWLVWRRVGWVWGLPFGMVVVASSIGGLFVAADMSRTLMAESPVVLLGILLWRRSNLSTFRYALPAILAANLLLPASHVVWTFTSPIRYLYAEIDEYRHPPRIVDPAEYTQHGDVFTQRGNLPFAVGAMR